MAGPHSDPSGQKVFADIMVGHGTNLFQDRPLIETIPGFCNSAVLDARDDDSAELDSVARRENAQGLPCMGSFEREPDRDLICLRQHIVDANLQIGEGFFQIRVEHTERFLAPAD